MNKAPPDILLGVDGRLFAWYGALPAGRRAGRRWLRVTELTLVEATVVRRRAAEDAWNLLVGLPAPHKPRK